MSIVNVLLAVLLMFAGAVYGDELPNGGKVSGAILAPNEIQEHTFFASAGDSIQLSLGETSLPRWNAAFYVYGPDGAPVFPLFFVATEHNFTAETTGTYIVAVRDTRPNGDGSLTGSYDLFFVLAPGANEGGELPNGGSVSGEIGIGDLDSYTFPAIAGDSIQLSLGETSLPRWNAAFYVYGPDGAPAFPLFFVATEHNFRAESTGTYTVVIRDTRPNGDGSRTGSYELHFVRAPDANEGGELPNGGSVSGDIEIGDLDSYTFSASAGDSIQLSLGETSLPQWNAAFYLYGPDGAPVFSRSFIATTHVFRATITGTYTVVVRDTRPNGDGSVTGSYDLHFVRAPGAAEGGELLNGGFALGMIDVGDLDSFVVRASEGDKVSVLLSETSEPMWNAAFYIYGPDGAPVFSLSFTTTEHAFTAELDGEYTVVVRDTRPNGDGSVTGSYRLEATVDRNAFSFAALGDSYSSGEGVRPYLDPEDNTLLGALSGCHRSVDAYPRLLTLADSALPLAERDDVEFDFIACSGAVTQNVTANGEPLDGEPPQLASQNAINASRDLVTITIGGNDAQFFYLVGYCLAHNDCDALRPFDPWFDLTLGELYEAIWIPVVGARVTDVLSELRSAASSATILAMDYPILLGGRECGSVQVPYLADTGLSDATLSASEQAWLRRANAGVNDVVAAAAAAAGVNFASVEDVFAGHGICDEREPWINGLSIDPKASFHPKRRGQRAYADVASGYLRSVLSGVGAGSAKTTEALMAATLTAPAIASLDELGPFPEFASLEVAAIPDDRSCPAVNGVAAGKTSLRVNGSGYVPGETITLSLVVGGVRSSLGTVTADESGAFEATPSVPGSLPEGGVGTVEALAAGPQGLGRLSLGTVRTEDTVAGTAPGRCYVPPSPVPEGETCDLEANRFTLPNNEWHMLGLPCSPPADSSTVSDLFGDDIDGDYGTDWIVFTYDPTIPPPASPYVDPGVDGELAPGTGFWIIHRTGTTVALDLPDGSTRTFASVPATEPACVGPAACAATPLGNPGTTGGSWNMVGNPFAHDQQVAFDDLRLTVSSGACADGCSVPNARAEDLMREGFFHYDGTAYEPLISDGALLDAWKSYWVPMLPGAQGKAPVLIWSEQ